MENTIFYEVTPEEMTTNVVDNLISPMGGFSVQQSLESPLIHGTPIHDLQ